MADVEHLCLKRELHGPLKCELPASHPNEHQAYSVALERVVTWPNASVKAKPPKSSTTRSGLRKTSIRQVSDKQAVREAYLAGVKSERIGHEYLRTGKIECHRCTRAFTSIGAAHQGLDLHHIIARSKGQGYRPGKAGVDAPGNLELLCRTCHRAVDGNEPRLGAEWTRGQTA